MTVPFRASPNLSPSLSKFSLIEALKLDPPDPLSTVNLQQADTRHNRSSSTESMVPPPHEMDFQFFASGQRMVSGQVITLTNKAEWIGKARLLPSGLIQRLQAEN